MLDVLGFGVDYIVVVVRNDNIEVKTIEGRISIASPSAAVGCVTYTSKNISNN
jgi:hypothetical protein